MDLILVNANCENVLMGGNKSNITGTARLTDIIADPSGECWKGKVTQRGKAVGVACSYHQNPKGWYVFDK